MQVKLCLLPSAIAELFVQATYSGHLTLADRYGLLAALLEESLTDDERFSIDRLIRAICRGTLTISNEISTVQG
ncbi:MAG: hypothetical protein KME16_13390 [Scytolyngbya sp. HA4215-MV1]|nr:hypothetical protein [Scytolyngbya sp. HA4215-MV1]